MAEYFVPSTGAQLFCRARGEGKPLLLIHGAVCDSDFFEGVALVLAAKFRVVTYDRRGYSRSSGQLDEPFLSASAKDAEQICKQLFPAGSVAVVGCSVGGLIAMEFSRRCPELVEQLILHEPPLPALLLPGLDVQNKVDQIKNFLAQKKYIRAANRFLGLLEDAEPSVRPKPQEICEREERNLDFFIRRRFGRILFMTNKIAFLIHYGIFIPDLAAVVFGRSVLSRSIQIGNAAGKYYAGRQDQRKNLPCCFLPIDWFHRTRCFRCLPACPTIQLHCFPANPLPK